MFCTSCGNQIENNSDFCTNCGTKIGSTQSARPVQNIAANASKKHGIKAPIIIVSAIAVIVVIAVILINIHDDLPPWEGYSSYESFAEAADLDEILGVGFQLDEDYFYGLLAGAFVGSILEPFISSFLGIDIKINAEVDMVTGSKLTEKYKVPAELRRNCDYLVRRSGIMGSPTFLAVNFDSEKFGIPVRIRQWIVIKYKEGSLIEY